MKTLNLTLKKKWFDMIKSGEKKEEYREIKKFWATRLLTKILVPWGGYLSPLADLVNGDLEMNGFKEFAGNPFATFDTVTFRNGYSANAPTITVECLGISIGTAKPEWSDNWQGQVFVIKLGNIINPQTKTIK